jgi:uncharacterized protein
VACRARRAQADLVRVARLPDGSLRLDPSGRLDGRGAYLCPDPACRDLALRRGALQRALRAPLPADLATTLEHADVAALRAGLAGHAPATMEGGAHGA